jgi:hypothetical protein
MNDGGAESLYVNVSISIKYKPFTRNVIKYKTLRRRFVKVYLFLLFHFVKTSSS